MRDTTAVYDRYEYWTEKQQALETWEKELRAILAARNQSPEALQITLYPKVDAHVSQLIQCISWK